MLMMEYLKCDVFVCVCVYARGTRAFANDHFPVSSEKNWKEEELELPSRLAIFHRVM